MTTIRERIDTTLPIDAAFAYVADFANSQEWDPGVGDSERIGAGPVGVGSRYRLGVRMGGRVAPMEYRIASFEPPRRVVLVGPGSGVAADRRDPVRARRRRAPDRLHRRHPARRPAPPGCSRSPAAPSARSAAGRARRACSERSPTRRAAGATAGGRSMKVAIVGAGVSGLTAAYALHREHEIRLFERERRAGGHVKTVERRDGRRARSPVDTGFIVYNERTYPRFVAAPRRARRRDPAERHVARLVLPRLRHRVQLARRARLVRPDADGVRPGALADVRRHPALLSRRARAPRCAGAGDARTLGDVARRAPLRPRRSASHFLIPITSAVWSTAPDRILEFPVDYLLRFLDNHGLIGYGNALQWRTITRRIDAPTSSGSWRRSARAPCAPATRSSPSLATPRGRRSGPRRARRARSTPSSWRPMPTMRSRLLARRRRAGAARPGRLRVLDEPGRPPHRRGRPAAPPRGLGVVERRRSADCRRPGDALTMTYHMNRLQSLPGTGPVLRLGQPRRPARTRTA